MKNTVKISKEVKAYISANVNDMAESHLEAWKERYASYGGNRRKMEEDLYINHDTSLQIEEVEEKTGRKLNDREISYVEDNFNKAVVKMWLKGDL